MIIPFTREYYPSVDAAVCDLKNAEVEYQLATKLQFGGYCGTVPNVHALERYKAAVDRLDNALKETQQARMRELGRRVGVWA